MLRLDASVLAAVDARAGEVGLSRQDWLRRVVEHGLLVRGVVLVESRRVRIAGDGGGGVAGREREGEAGD